MAAASVATPAKATKAAAKPKKTAAATKKPRSYPTYHEMVKEAIVALKERSGSSVIAIARHIEEKQKSNNLPLNFKKLLSLQIKKLVAGGKLVKVKNSFKLPPRASDAAVKEPVEKKKVVSGAKRKAAEKIEKPKKVAKTAAVKSPGKKKVAVKGVKAPVKSVKSAAKKVKSVKSPAKKVKSVKSPAKKAVKKPVKK